MESPWVTAGKQMAAATVGPLPPMIEGNFPWMPARGGYGGGFGGG